MKPNIGIVNALLRITCGFTMLAWSTSKMTRKPWRDSFLVVAMLGGMKIAEGITRFCPIVALFEKVQERRHEDDGKVDESVINPT